MLLCLGGELVVGDKDAPVMESGVSGPTANERANKASLLTWVSPKVVTLDIGRETFAGDQSGPDGTQGFMMN